MLSEPEKGKFPEPIGNIVLRHSIHSELGTLPVSFAKRGLRECFFKINYEPQLVNLVRDLALAGCDLVGSFSAHRSGHRLNAELVRVFLIECERIEHRRRSA